MRIQPRNLQVSNSYLDRAKQVIPAVTQTLSKGPTQFVQGVSPIYLQRGLGSHVWDVDGNEYIDYPGALGPNILGYAYPGTIQAIVSQLADGINFSLMHPLEVEVAELLVEVIPCAEMVRFGKNGSDVTTAAVRVSRAYTGRSKVAVCGYHGSQDWFLATVSRNKGVPRFNDDLALPWRYNDIGSLENLFESRPNEIAAVIMEPVTFVEPQPGFLESVQKITHDSGAVLIFDEVKTGFRIALGGAQEHYGIVPDLACFGKAMANGMPVSALVGRADIMRELEEVFFSITFGGETLSLAAMKATIEDIRAFDVIAHLWRQGAKLKRAYNEMAAKLGLTEATSCEGLDAKSAVQFYDYGGYSGMELKSLFQQEVIQRGILFNGEHMLCLSHSDEDIERTTHAYREALAILKVAVESNRLLEHLKGPPLESIIRNR